MSVPVFAGTLVTVLVAWFLWSALGPSPGPREPALPLVRVPVRQVSEARGVVETFLAARKWEEEHVAKFERQWDGLSPEQRALARAAPWFDRLIVALNDALDARMAPDSALPQSATTVSAQRLRSLGGHLGVAQALSPAIPMEVEPIPPPSTPSPPLPAASPPSTPVQSASIVDSPPPPPPIVDRRPEADRRDETSSQWLARQPDSAFTLQILSAEYLDQVERLMSRHPSLAMQVLDYRQNGPRFRVLHGTFDSREQAVAAHGRLPWSLRSERPRADVRPFEDLKSAWGSARGGQAAGER